MRGNLKIGLFALVCLFIFDVGTNLLELSLFALHLFADPDSSSEIVNKMALSGLTLFEAILRLSFYALMFLWLRSGDQRMLMRGAYVLYSNMAYSFGYCLIPLSVRMAEAQGEIPSIIHQFETFFEFMPSGVSNGIFGTILLYLSKTIKAD